MGVLNQEGHTRSYSGNLESHRTLTTYVNVRYVICKHTFGVRECGHAFVSRLPPRCSEGDLISAPILNQKQKTNEKSLRANGWQVGGYGDFTFVLLQFY